MLEHLLTVLIWVTLWAVRLGSLLFFPAMLWFLLREKNRKAAAAAALFFALLLFAGSYVLAFYPIRRCPEDLQPYLTEDRWQEMLSVSSMSVWESPVTPAVITVEKATEDTVYWRVDWFPVGTTRTGLTPDGYDAVHGFWRGS